MDDSAMELCERGTLQRLLDRHAAAARAGRVAAAFACGSAVVTASAGGEGSRAAPLGCVAKLVTAALVSSAAEGGYLARDTCVEELLGAGVAALRGVTVRHLLEHTHGLDDSLLAAPRHRNGFIDRGELASRVAALTRWAHPGAAYSYGNSGAWLLAAALERLHGRAFGALVREVLAALGVDGTRCGAGAPCAATGAGLALTAEELARFGSYALQRDRAVAAAPIAPLPGWHPLERGVCLGWKFAGGGWFGHQSAWPGASSYVRAHAQRKLALAVVARERAAAAIALGVFGRHLPELFERRRRLPSGAGGSLPVGIYAQAARVVAVTATPCGLATEAWERDEHGARRGAPVRARLVPAGGVFFAEPASELVPYLEGIRGPDGADGLWNGRFVLRRAG